MAKPRFNSGALMPPSGKLPTSETPYESTTSNWVDPEFDCADSFEDFLHLTAVRHNEE